MAYTTTATTQGGRNGRAVVANGCLALALLVLASGHAIAQTPQTLAAADRLIAVQKPVELMEEMAVNIAAKLPGATEAQKQAFIKEMTDPDFMARYQAQMRAALSKHLTVEEMDALSDFYSKPIAISAMKKMGATTAEVMPFIQSEIPAMVARIMKTP
jgi:hypothetical protein